VYCDIMTEISMHMASLVCNKFLRLFAYTRQTVGCWRKSLLETGCDVTSVPTNQASDRYQRIDRKMMHTSGKYQYRTAVKMATLTRIQLTNVYAFSVCV